MPDMRPMPIGPAREPRREAPPPVNSWEPVTVAEFRESLPEFSDPVAYTDIRIEMFLFPANESFPRQRWGYYWRWGVKWFTAHCLALAARATQAAAAGTPGGTPGLMTSKSVSKVSVGYDVSVGSIEGGGPFNLTIYGIEFLWMARMMGAGPVQLSGPMIPSSLWLLAGYGWGAPYTPLMIEMNTNPP